MTMDGDYRKLGFFSPELIFPFATLFLLNKDDKIIWTLQKDRVPSNIWTPAAGEVDLPPKAEPYQPLLMADPALLETKQEIGINTATIMGPGPFAQFMLLQAYKGYSAAILHHEYGEDGEYLGAKAVERQGANAIYNYFLGRFEEGEPTCMPQPEEPDYEIVGIRELDVYESLEAFANGTIKTYGNMLQGTKILRMVLENPGPFAIPMSEFMAA
jgi:hypothetical protein